MKNALEAFFATAPERTGAILTDSEGRTVFEFNSAMKAPSASTIKTLIMAQTAELIQAGELDKNMTIHIGPEDKLEDSITGLLNACDYSLDDLVTMMIIISDNTATNRIIDLVSMRKVNDMAGKLGMKNTVLQRKMLDWEAVKAGKQNYTSPEDLAKLFQYIISPENNMGEWMLNKLAHQKHSDKFAKYLPPGVRLAHKPGSINNLEADSGIIYIEQKPFIWCVMVDSTPNLVAAEFISRATEQCYRFLTGRPVR